MLFIFYMVRAFTLIDVLIGVTLTSFLVFFVASFIRETMLYTTFVARHQQIRQETFALVNNALAGLIREAVAIDYQESNEKQLALFLDKFENDSMKVVVRLDEVTTSDGEKRAQVVLERGAKTMYLNSPRTFVTGLHFEYPPNPRLETEIADARSLQPMVRVKLSSRFQRPTDDDPALLSFLEDPRVSYQAAYTLRNYSLSNLR